jgi:hypothetical protein
VFGFAPFVRTGESKTEKPTPKEADDQPTTRAARQQTDSQRNLVQQLLTIVGPKL